MPKTAAQLRLVRPAVSGELRGKGGYGYDSIDVKVAVKKLLVNDCMNILRYTYNCIYVCTYVRRREGYV